LIDHPHLTSKQYKDLYTHLESYLKILSPKQILISGSYIESKQKDNLCRYIGKKLLENNIVIVSGGGRPGLQVGHGAFETMERENRYRAENIIFYRRMKQRIVPDFPPFGSIKQFGQTYTEIREEMVNNCKVMLVFEGANGTLEEESLARSRGIPVIPIGMTGGSAYKIWEGYTRKIDEILVGGEPVDRKLFSLLNNPNSSIAVDAALTLIKKAVVIN
jgi:predicted Rossmann-fold nucleotide-binding protein